MLRKLILVLTALAIPLSFVHAPYPKELILQHGPSVLGIGLLWSLGAMISAWAVRRWTP